MAALLRIAGRTSHNHAASTANSEDFEMTYRTASCAADCTGISRGASRETTTANDGFADVQPIPQQEWRQSHLARKFCT